MSSLKFWIQLAIVQAVFLLSASRSPGQDLAARPEIGSPRGSLEYASVQTDSFRSGLLESSRSKRVLIYLPPSYQNSADRRYPVVYFLHGYSLIPGVQDSMAHALVQAMDRLTAAEKIQEMIVVIPDGRNSFGGGFYANSITFGNYEDFIAKDLVEFIDSRYRTIPDPAARGIGGHSMGGFGAITLAMKHGDVFGAVYAMSPCCLDFGTGSQLDAAGWAGALNVRTPADMELMMKKQHFFTALFVAMSAAFSPDSSRPPLYLQFPFVDRGGKLAPNEPVYTLWKSRSPVNRVQQYRENLAKLRGIQLDYGSQEDDMYIPMGAREFSSALEAAGISCGLEEFEGTHNGEVDVRILTRVLPFFSASLSDTPRRTPALHPNR